MFYHTYCPSQSSRKVAITVIVWGNETQNRGPGDAPTKSILTGSPKANRRENSYKIATNSGFPGRLRPFHGGNTGSNPVRVASFIERPTKQIGENKNRFNKLATFHTFFTSVLRPGWKKIPLPQSRFSRALRAFPLVALPFVATMMLLECESSRSDHSVLWLAALSRFL